MYKMYKDVTRNGLYITNFSVDIETPKDAQYAEVVGGNLGIDSTDRFYNAQFGRYNSWKMRLFYNETPHVFTTTAYPIWNGIGTGHLTLPANIPVAGGIACGDANCTTYTAPSYGITTPLTTSTNLPTNATGGALDQLVAQRIQATANANGPTEISLVRKTGGIATEFVLTDSLKAFASYTLENRKGARPFGDIMNSSGNFQMETAEPIDYQTHDLIAGLRYAGDLTQANLTASASIFRNDIKSLIVDVPFVTGPAVGTGNYPQAQLVTQNRFALAPNNEAYLVKGEFARSFPNFLNSRFNATASWGTSRQNDDLLPPAITSGSYTVTGTTDTGYNFNGNYDQWNTTAALSRSTSEARIDTKLLDLGYSFDPAQDLTMRAKASYNGRDNKTKYLACNPNASYGNGTQVTYDGCSGVWGYMVDDSGQMFYNGAYAINKFIRNIPWDSQQYNYGLNGDYRISRTSSVNASAEQETFHYTNRERTETWEDKFKLGYVNRSLKSVSLRASYENDSKRGSDYNVSPYNDFTAIALAAAQGVAPPTAGTNLRNVFVYRIADIRKFDLADRDQNLLNLRLNFNLRPDMDFGLTYQNKDISYPNSPLGRVDHNKQDSVNLDLSWEPSADRSLSGYYSYQQGTMKLSTVTPRSAASAACVVGGAATQGPYAGIPITVDNAQVICGTVASNLIYNPDDWWTEDQKDINHVLGLGFRQALGSNTLSVNFTRSLGRTKIHYDYRCDSTYCNAGVGSLANAAAIGNDAPDMITNITGLNVSLMVPVQKNVATRLVFYREQGKITDWHYTGLNGNTVLTSGAANGIQGNIMDNGPQDYRTSYVGAFVQVKL
jgi:Putative outer membrane beta-barrel porin, MtrB/PioB